MYTGVSPSQSFKDMLNQTPKHMHVAVLDYRVCGMSARLSRSKMETDADFGLQHRN